MEKVLKTLNDSKIFESKRDSDTIRVWENYKDQASLWRALALLQIPATLGAIIFAFTMWANRSITLNVPARPLPGVYSVQEIPDTEYVNVATDYINLVASYQPKIARRQFDTARGMLMEPLLSKFDQEMMGDELRAIETTSRTQVFMVDPIRTKVTRDAKSVTVSLIGDRFKIVAGQESPLQMSQFDIVMVTVPRNKLNPYGIVITNVTHKPVDPRDL